MRIVVDNKIPYIREALASITPDVVYLPAADFTPETVRDADALIIRTRTRCDRHLLEGSNVKFIATATIGFDHIDLDYCKEAGISWQNAPGCNSGSVEQYMESTLQLVANYLHKNLDELTLGVVGVGHVGSRVARMAESYHMRVLRNDPPRKDAGAAGDFYSLDELAEQCDILTFHVPLIRNGVYSTYHLADETFFRKLKRKPILINTSRGEVVDNQVLLDALTKGLVGQAVIDVWENEPNINLSLLNKVLIGTPHIAGYSADGKSNATRMALDALCEFYHLKANYTITAPEPQGGLDILATDTQDALLQIYDPRTDYEALKKNPELFEHFRGAYRVRREKGAYHIRYKK